MEEEKTSKDGLGLGLKIGLILVGIVAVVQVAILGFVFKDEIVGAVSDLIPTSVEVLTYPLESMQVNLAGSDRGNYLRTTMHLAYENSKQTEVFDNSITKIKAVIIETLRSKTLSDVNTVENTKKLAEEIKDKVNELLELEIVTDVYFIEFLYQ